MEQTTDKKCCGGKIKMAIVLILVIGAIVLGALAILRDKITQNNDYQVSVSAQGKVTAKPDIANLTFGIQTGTKNTVADANKDANDKMNAIVAVLVALGVSKDDIKTTQYNLNPVYSYPANSAPKLSGYSLDEQIIVKVRNLDNVGPAIQKATEAGANYSNGLVFTIDDQDKLKDEARADGIKKAQAKAKAIEQESGIKLGKLISVQEGAFYAPVFTNNFAYDQKSVMGSGIGGGPSSAVAAPAIPDIQSGNMDITIDVSLVYKVK